jgi:hypothetical protein
MGTRSLTFVYESDGELIMNLYRQFDGYPTGHGIELADFLLSGKLVNGYTKEGAKEFNGMGCLAAQMVAFFKKSVGGFYIHPVTAIDCGQDYEYHVYHDRVSVKGYNGEFLFIGRWDSFHEWCMHGDE